MNVEKTMSTLTLKVSTDIYAKLQKEADRLGKPLQAVIQEWLTEQADKLPAPDNDRERARQALRDAGLLVEPGPKLSELADPTLNLEDVRNALGRARGKPLSEIALEQRGPKE